MEVLVPLDRSTVSEAVLPTVASLCALGAEITLITVVQESEVHATWRKAPASAAGNALRDSEPVFGAAKGAIKGVQAPELVEDVVQAAERVRAQANDYLARIAWRYFGGKAKTVVIFDDDVAAELISYARDHHFHLVAMGTHGRTGVAQTLLGSVAARLVSEGVTPVLLVRPK